MESARLIPFVIASSLFVGHLYLEGALAEQHLLVQEMQVSDADTDSIVDAAGADHIDLTAEQIKGLEKAFELYEKGEYATAAAYFENNCLGAIIPRSSAS